MITPFDALLPVGILLALLLSAEPKRTAISIVILAALSITVYDSMFDGLVPYYLSVMTESIAGIVLLLMSRRLFHGKTYFHWMAVLLFASTMTTVLYIYDIRPLHTDYVASSQAIAFTHLVFMIILSDGVRNVLGAIGDRAGRLFLLITRI